MTKNSACNRIVTRNVRRWNNASGENVVPVSHNANVKQVLYIFQVSH